MKVTDETLMEVINKNEVAMIDFWAEWCGPCVALGPTVEKLSKEYSERAFIGKLNVDENSVSTSKFNIRSLPTILFFKNGEVVDTVIGLTHKSKLEDILNSLLDA